MEHKIFEEKVTKDCINWIKEFFEINGNGCKAVVGISGGKDSSVVAALCVKALGKENVIGVLMPNGEQKDISDSKQLCDFLGIESITINIKDAYDAILKNIKNPSEQTKINLSPRLRMSTLYAVSQTVGGRVANTSNLSEITIGWGTRWGDSCGDFAPLAKLTKTEVVAIAHELGLPENLANKVPSDGLCGKSDEDKFGFTYEELDGYIRKTGVKNEKSFEKIQEMVFKNYFKRNPMPCFDLKE